MKPKLSPSQTVAAPPRGDCAVYLANNYRSDDSIGYLVRVLYMSIKRRADAGMHKLDLTGMQWGPLMLIAEGKGNTAAALARAADTDTGAMTRMLDRLEAKGLIERVRSAQDRRVVHVALTSEGKRVQQMIPTVICEVLNEHLVGIDLPELEMLKQSLRRMISNGQHAAEAS